MVQGFVLNNQMTDFSFIPEENGQPVANRVQPGKRPRSAMAPTVVFDRQSGGVAGRPGFAGRLADHRIREQVPGGDARLVNSTRKPQSTCPTSAAAMALPNWKPACSARR